tara:strand:- start:149 stop:766 length:618 start_codon:yes stop_codon:yes gene_type:complete
MRDNIIIKMYNDEIEINKDSGFGFDKVLKKIEPLIISLSSKFKIDNYSQNDMIQELYVIAIEGIRSYDHTKNVKLSTFMHIHLHNKIISKLKSSFKKSNNASYLNGSDDFSREVSADLDIYGEICSESMWMFFKNPFENNSDFHIFLEHLKDKVDYDSWLIVKYISLDGFTIKEISEKMNINSWTVSAKLKKLCNNEFILKFYEK